ncbi:MAG: GxxExxY protein, partial [Pseudomonadota bacterium]
NSEKHRSRSPARTLQVVSFLASKKSWRALRLCESNILLRFENTQRERRSMSENEIGKSVVDAAIQIHREMGPGLLETVYEIILAHQLRQRGFRVERQVAIPVEFQEIRFDEGFRADIIVEDKVILEIKSVEKLTNAHRKQLLTYLRLTGMRLGYLLNFSEALMKNGITRTVNRLPEQNQ